MLVLSFNYEFGNTWKHGIFSAHFPYSTHENFMKPYIRCKGHIDLTTIGLLIYYIINA